MSRFKRLVLPADLFPDRARNDMVPTLRTYTKFPGRRAIGPITLSRITTLMGLFGLVFLVVVIAVSAMNERRTLLREARAHAEGSAFFLADHAQRLFEVCDIALRSTMLATEGLDWPTIESSRDLWASLQKTNAFMPYVGDLWLNDETGRLRLTTLAYPAPPSTATGRKVFNDVQAGDRLVIGERIVGKITGQPTFLVSRRLANADATFRGMVSVTVDLSYFTSYWRRLELPNHERIALVRAEAGDVLIASQPDALFSTSTQLASFLADLRGMPDSGRFEPAPGLYGAYHRVGTAPVYLAVVFDRAGVVFAWEIWILRLLPLALAAALALGGMVMLGRSLGRRETAAAAALAAAREELQDANRNLEQRVADRTADLQETNDQVQRYAYIISHDLRAPLVNIAGFTSELQSLRPSLFPENMPTALEPVRQDYDEAIGFIRSSAEKMDRFINAILALSREGRRTFGSEFIDLGALFRSIADGVAHRTQKADATIEVGDLPMVRSDRIAVEQIFSNLVDNAVKYLRPGIPGRIVVTSRHSEGWTTVTIADNGRGIADRDHERVFELFRRAGPQDQPGEGIGLAHVRALVRRLGGRIALQSRLGEGSSFAVDLPDISES